ncbi:MAG: hypothetical protein PQ612_07570 [Rickettsiales bacterium]|nr:hypothetical protein [Pseudomonadota bacterium]MDA0966946.1 hypothetical protein [Pseudomonadota bacterium]MDG4543865.1 hypothetical protein [Rickettsiales bacterium]MDG4546011.1 hypothetical protein [Rickettsiales bacterium]MDG4548257.1 hypothetical protein [Rickettsiales bacterium]
MRQKQIKSQVQKWLSDSFYDSIANGKYTTSRISEEKIGHYHKRHLYTDLLATMYTNQKKVIDLDEKGFAVDKQIETGFRNKEVLATMYDNLQNSKQLDDIGVSYDMQAKLGLKLGKHFQNLYNKTKEIEEFVSKNDISPILLTGYLMQKGEPEYLIAESNPVKTSVEIEKMNYCSEFLQVIPSVMSAMLSDGIPQLNLPEDVGRVIGDKLVKQSTGTRDYRALVRLSEVNRGAMQVSKFR